MLLQATFLKMATFFFNDYSALFWHLSISFWSVWGGILVHASFKQSQRSGRLVGFRPLTRRSNCSHNSSMGFKSGDWGGHSIILCAHCSTNSLPFRAPPGTDKECVLCISHKGSAVATRLIVSFLEVLQVHIKATMTRKRLRQIKADLTVLSIQPGGELWDQAKCPSHRLFTMPSRLPFLDESAPSILADGLLRASDFLEVC